MKRISYVLSCIITLVFTLNLSAQEEIFADFFDIQVNATAGTPVMGKVHLKRNKDVLTNPIPEGYNFEIVSDDSDLFVLYSQREDISKMKGLLVGELRVKYGKVLPSAPTDFHLKIALKNGQTEIVTKDITINVVEKTMWEHFADFFIPDSRWYGRFKLEDFEIQSYIDEINANNGPITSLNDIFDLPPQQVENPMEKWEEVTKYLTALGYAYSDANSAFYKSSILKRAIYKGTRAYMDNFPIFGDDIENNPTGNEIGDGFQGLHPKHLGHSEVTHQWELINPMTSPLAQVSREMLVDIESGDPEAIVLKESILRFFQSFYSIVYGRRTMNNESSRWQNISDKNSSNGAWSDANIAARLNGIMGMVVLWGDYNRPITYVPYWYDDYYNGTEFEGLTFAHGWSPRGAVKDLRYWCTKFSDESKRYGQSGFHPDGTVSHHFGHGASDLSMLSYGFGWVSKINDAINFFKHTTLPIEDERYQFFADRIDFSYRRLTYRQQFDFLVCGNTHYSDLKKFATRTMVNEVDRLLEGMSPTTVVTNADALADFSANIKSNNHKFSDSRAFWNVDFLIHRRENETNNFYYSVKQKSRRNKGLEDGSEYRKAWHGSSGFFQLKIDGDEYERTVLGHYDWHVLPGVTEEWRTDPFPGRGNGFSGPGLSYFSGLLADGNYATSAFIYDPAPDASGNGRLSELYEYASAFAYKSYHMIGRFGTALGSKVSRKYPGQGNNIVTGIDQSINDSEIFYSINGGEVKSISAYSNVDTELTLTGPSWFFHNNKGYLVFPRKNQKVFIQSGSNINVTITDTGVSKNYIIALDHGTNPNENLDGYHYVMVANAELFEMQSLIETYAMNNTIYVKPEQYHAIHNKENNVVQASFFKPGTIFFNDDQSDWIKANKPAMVIREVLENSINFSFSDPLHDIESSSIVIELSDHLEEGVYNYIIDGIYPIEGETATVTRTDEGSRIVIELPDSSDAEKYNYRHVVMAGASLNFSIPKFISDDDDDDDEEDEEDIEEISEAIQIYPVPVTNETVISVQGEHKILGLDCFNVLGQLLFRKSFGKGKSNVKLGLIEQHVEQEMLLALVIRTNKGVFKKIVIVNNSRN